MTPAVRTALLLTACLLMAMATDAAELIPDATPDDNPTTLVWPDGTRYIGSVSDGKRSGKGTIFWQDGTRFVGNFKDDQRDGAGAMILPDGTVYTGYFANDLLVDKPPSATSDVAVNKANTPKPARPTEMAAPVAEVSDKQLLAVEAASTGPAASSAATPSMAATEPLYEPVTRLSDAIQKALHTSIDNWAMHWSQQNTPAYLDSYSQEFEVPSDMTLSQWQAHRKTRVERPKSISVSVAYDDFKIIGADEARVTFKQTYKSARYSDVTQKFLRLKKQNNRWLISAEGNQ